MKKWIVNLLLHTRGSVSVYFIVILLPIFLFHAVLIDFARIKAAEREAELSVKTGVRSVLSNFDPTLQPYGLFALDRGVQSLVPLFTQVVEHNLSSSSSLEPNTISLQSMYSLANQLVFEKQILDEMKYKAPIEYSLALVNKFKKTGLSANLQATAQFSDLSEKLESLLKLRYDALETAWNDSLKFLTKAEAINQKYVKRLNDLNKLSGQIGIQTYEDVNKSISDIQVQLDQVQNTLIHLKESLQSLNGTLSGLKTTVKENVERIRDLKDNVSNIETSITSLEQSYGDLTSKKDELGQLLLQIVEYVALMHSSMMEITSDFTQLSAEFSLTQASLLKAVEHNNELELEKNKLSNNVPNDSIFNRIVIYDQDYFAHYRIGLSKVLAQFNGMKTKWLATLIFANDFSQTWSQETGAMSSQINEFRSNQSQKEQERRNLNELTNRKKGEYLNQTKSILNEAKKAIGGCISEGEDDPIAAAYKKLSGKPSDPEPGLFKKYQLYNRNENKLIADLYELDDGDDNGDGDEKKLEEESVSWMKKFTPLLAEFRDELYTNEYALSKFTFRTDLASQMGNHRLQKQEVEYLLYGFNSCLKNYSAAYGEMFVFFTAIRTTEALMQPQTELLNVGSPLLVLLAATAQGALEAFKDMNSILDGKEVSLIKKLPKVTITYKELLRILLLIHSNDVNLLSRMQALIELNTGESLFDKTTYVQGTAVVSVRLWFMPAFVRSLENVGLSKCNMTKANRCGISKTAVMSYD